MNKMIQHTTLWMAVLYALGGAGCSRAPEAAAPGGKVWTCSMHPQIRQNKPGNCPICGMTLVPAAGAAAGAAAEPETTAEPKTAAEGGAWTCPMHAQVRQNKPGDCPLCGMTLVPAAGAAAEPAPKQAEPGQEHSLREDAPRPSGGTAATPDGKKSTVHLGKAREAVASIATMDAGPRPLVKKIQIFGEIEYISDRHVDYSWYYPGRIQDVLIDFNTTELEKGQPVYEVYSQAAIADQEGYLDTLRERWLSTFYERTVLTAKVEAARARLLQSGFTAEEMRALEKQQAVRSIFRLKSPIRGSIVGALLQRGEQFEANQTLFHVVPLDEVWFTAQVYESDLSHLALGQRLALETQGQPGVRHTGTLVYIGRTVRPETRTVNARFVVSNPRRELLPGLSGVGTLDIPLRDAAVAVPRGSIIDTGRRKVVYVQTGEAVYQQREVKTGAESDEFVEVLEGVAAGEAVVTTGAFLVDAEAQLQGEGK